jgi:hypothetical protein
MVGGNSMGIKENELAFNSVSAPSSLFSKKEHKEGFKERESSEREEMEERRGDLLIEDLDECASKDEISNIGEVGEDDNEEKDDERGGDISKYSDGIDAAAISLLE